MTREDLCNRLGIPLVEDKSELKSAWRKLVLRYHPDRNKEPDAEKTFISIQKLFEELTKSFDVMLQDFGWGRMSGFSFDTSTAAASANYSWSFT